jgi:hypothetical protein
MDDRVDFSGVPGRPRARRVARVVVLVLLLGLAVGAIWFIDRGATVNNLHKILTK